MTQESLLGGTVHIVPAELNKALIHNKLVAKKWQSLTPLARNEWICWIISPKKPQTRQNHIRRIIAELTAGKRRPCCWPGCEHRK